MKKQFAAIFAGVALMTGGVATAISLPSIAQAQPGAQLPMMKMLISDLDLTPAQLQQINTVRQSTRGEIEAVLTPEQKPYAQAAFGAAQEIRQNLAAMNLTPEQRQEIRGIMQSSRSELKGLLTTEQRKVIRQKVRTRLRNVRNR
ncbi:Spy/CpxP family protein refolding chaperone [filamentous cyanobacterium LEGE 11480]|uniref:Spy/CpxP family protein refolding chaperone n=1 Tax=Romeriopsis navalis LEGE 11480 TaxID=2777977 RepID=A0A928Z3D8_9CYAN|nr:Spy/CpxP family protein refolding chaperone [Romeriopsis navalis]MBE9029088.1 Spy/CpxP family protein refolding chaperone [Romeriopsis navalis LEGE 11480]